MSLKKTIFLTVSIFVFFIHAQAQRSAVFYDIDKWYREGLELYDKEKFVAAQEQFDKVHKHINDHELYKGNQELNLTRINAEYYSALCALELFNDNAENLLLAYVSKYPESPNSKSAYFEIGNFYYRQRRFDDAIKWYEKTDPAVLSDKDRMTYQFNMAYAHFEKKNYEKASPVFDRIKKTQSKYAYPSAYYLGVIFYEQKNYPKALDEFTFLKASKNYAEVTPYYIIQIYYLLGRYRELIAYSDEAISIPKVKKLNEIYLVTASAHFRLDNYTESAKLYEAYKIKTATRLNPQSNYELAYSYYVLGDYPTAVDIFKVVSEDQTFYAQNGMYTLADCFMKMNDRQAARHAFWKASKLDFDKEISRLAIYNYAKLSLELNYSQTAIESFQEYIKHYPKSENIDEAKSLLADALLSTRNYKDAIRILEGLDTRTNSANLAYQKVCYYHGIEVLNSRDFNRAISLFNKSLSYPVDKGIQALAWHWKGEALYQQKNYSEAIKFYTQSIQSASFRELDIYPMALYSIAYAYFGNEDYKASVYFFDSYLKAEAESGRPDTRKVNDATLRLSDSYFVIKDYDKALYSYNKIINDQSPSADYALFQKGIILGLQNKQNDKIITLKSLLNNYPKSNYADDAYYESGTSYFVMGNLVDAINSFNELIRTHPNSRYISKAKLSLGLIYYNEAQDDRALQMYKSIINDYPGSEEAKESLLAIKNIYIDAGNAEEYLAYVRTLPFASVSSGAQDSISYQAAYNRYLMGDCENALSGFNSYVYKFGNGNFITEARVYRSECLLRSNQPEKALEDLEYLINKNKTTYLERSLLIAARIVFDLKNYSKAIDYYIRLEQVAEYKENYGEAITGAMKSYMASGNSIEAMRYCNKVIAYERASSEDINLAHLYKGKLLLTDEKIDEAYTEFTTVYANTKTVVGAEAKYLSAEILFNKGNYSEAQQACFDLSNQVPSYEYWVAKAFILLADTYSELGNDFQAKSTLQSIIDGYEAQDDIVPTAKHKLELLDQPK